MSLPTWLRVTVARMVSRPSPRVRPRTKRPGVELLEDRCTPSTFVVSTTADDGAGSLRAAIQQANAAAGPDRIAFALSTSDSHFVDANNNHQFDPGDYWSIGLNSALPALTDTLTIDGWSQGGVGYHGAPLVELDGRNAGPSADGLVLAGIQGCTLDGLIINHFHGNGVVINGGGGHQL